MVCDIGIKILTFLVGEKGNPLLVQNNIFIEIFECFVQRTSWNTGEAAKRQEAEDESGERAGTAADPGAA